MRRQASEAARTATALVLRCVREVVMARASEEVPTARSRRTNSPPTAFEQVLSVVASHPGMPRCEGGHSVQKESEEPLDRRLFGELVSPVTFDFRILGPLEVEGPAGSVAVGGLRQRALLAVLLLDPGRVVATDRLVDQVWGEHAPKTATTSLQNAVSRLRRELGSDVLETQAPGYVLRIRPEQVDAHRFESQLRAARRAAPEARRELIESALGLWRGPALAEFTFEPFAEPEIRRLDELRIVALEDRIEADLELGRHGDVVGELEGLVKEHPLRETFRRQLMLALYRSGRQAEA